jgi:serine/threonine protein kinase
LNNFITRCLTVDNKRRPTAKELLLDPFIMDNIIDKGINNQRGRALLKELVKQSMGEIEEYRQTQNDSSDESQEQGNSADP